MRTRMLLPVLAAVVLTLIGPVGPGEARAGSATTVGADARAASPYERTARQATNAARRAHDLRALRFDRCLQRFAEKQARHMARTGVMGHQALEPIQRRCGVGWVGENVAVGYTSGRDVVRGWMNSSGHRENILRPEFHTLGLAAVQARGRWWAVQVFGDR